MQTVQFNMRGPKSYDEYLNDLFAMDPVSGSLAAQAMSPEEYAASVANQGPSIDLGNPFADPSLAYQGRSNEGSFIPVPGMDNTYRVNLQAPGGSSRDGLEAYYRIDTATGQGTMLGEATPFRGMTGFENFRRGIEQGGPYIAAAAAGMNAMFDPTLLPSAGATSAPASAAGSSGIGTIANTLPPLPAPVASIPMSSLPTAASTILPTLPALPSIGASLLPEIAASEAPFQAGQSIEVTGTRLPPSAPTAPLPIPILPMPSPSVPDIPPVMAEPMPAIPELPAGPQAPASGGGAFLDWILRNPQATGAIAGGLLGGAGGGSSGGGEAPYTGPMPTISRGQWKPNAQANMMQVPQFGGLLPQTGQASSGLWRFGS